MPHLKPRPGKVGFKISQTTRRIRLCKSPARGSDLVSALKTEGVEIKDCDIFPPKKSGPAGLRLLMDFVKIAEGTA